MPIITRIPPNDRPRLWGLLQQYLGEMSAWYGDRPDQKGEYPYPWLDHYFTDPERAAFFLEAGGETAGFALVNRFSALGEAPDHAMAEFFLLPGWRGKGLGLAFAQEIFRQRPGSWEIKYHRENRPAGALWSRAAEPFRPRVTPMGEEVLLSFVVPKQALS